jgi:hypothetical protein
MKSAKKTGQAEVLIHSEKIQSNRRPRRWEQKPTTTHRQRREALDPIHLEAALQQRRLRDPMTKTTTPKIAATD